MEIKGWWGRAEQVCAVLCVPRICWCEYFYVPIDSLSDCRLLELSGLCGVWVYAWRGGSVVEKQHKGQKPPNTEAPVVHSGSSPRVIPASHQSCLWVPPNLCIWVRELFVMVSFIHLCLRPPAVLAQLLFVVTGPPSAQRPLPGS